MRRGVHNRQSDLKMGLKEFMRRGWEAQKRWRRTGLLPCTKSAAEESPGAAGVSDNQLVFRMEIWHHDTLLLILIKGPLVLESG